MTVVEAAGVDTWSVAWQMGDRDGKFLGDRCKKRAGRALISEEKFQGHTLGFFPAAGLAFVEGRPYPDGLATSGDLQMAWKGLMDRFDAEGAGFKPKRVWREQSAHADLPGRIQVGRPMIRRLDVTVDLKFEKASEGLAVLSAVGSLPVARCVTDVQREPGGRAIRTVYLKGPGGKTILGRWYDKGIEQKAMSKGHWIRPEDQRRFTSASGRPDLDFAFDTGFVRELFVKRFEPLWQASKGIRVGAPKKIGEKLGELQEEDVITAAQAKAVAGFLVLDMAGAYGQKKSQYYADRALARKLGLVMADVGDDDLDVDLHEVMEEALDSSAWGAQG